MSHNPEHNAPGVPRKIGDYIIHRILGQGGMGTVYEAEEQLTRRRVALKVLRSELGSSEQGRRQFVAEMGILANLDDPHIVRCLHCTEIEGRLVMVLEYLEGRTLREVMNQRGALPWAEVLSYAWQIASALRTAHLHRPAIVHRDLKPENVMCLPDGRIKVMDFGIAKIVQTMAGTTRSDPVGTLQYMSPEQIDARSVDGRSDLYALGLVMWELLAGRPPFQADSPRILLEKLCTEPAPRLPDQSRWGMPPNLEYLVARLLEKDPAARPGNANEVLAMLDTFRTMTPPVAYQAPAPAPAPIPVPVKFDTIAIVERAARPTPAPQWIAPVAVMFLVLAMAVLGWIFIRPLIMDSTNEPERASATDSKAPAVVAPEAIPSACEGPARQWAGSWTLRTEATAAIKSSWIGGKATYELSLVVDGCRLSGSGQKFVDRKEKWIFTVDGSVADDGRAQIHYEAAGRNIEGTWSIAQGGSGMWTSAAGDVSGTVVALRNVSPAG